MVNGTASIPILFKRNDDADNTNFLTTLMLQIYTLHLPLFMHMMVMEHLQQQLALQFICNGQGFFVASDDVSGDSGVSLKQCKQAVLMISFLVIIWKIQKLSCYTTEIME